MTIEQLKQQIIINALACGGQGCCNPCVNKLPHYLLPGQALPVDPECVCLCDAHEMLAAVDELAVCRSCGFVAP